MKTILLLIFLLVVCTTGLRAGEFTGAGRQAEQVLQRHGINVRRVQEQGLKIGEVTGVGKRVFTENVVQFLTKKEVIPNGRISHIEFKRRGRSQTVSDIKSIEYRGRRIPVSAIKVIIYHR